MLFFIILTSIINCRSLFDSLSYFFCVLYNLSYFDLRLFNTPFVFLMFHISRLSGFFIIIYLDFSLLFSFCIVFWLLLTPRVLLFFNNVKYCYLIMVRGLWCLTPLSTIYQLYHGSKFYWWRSGGNRSTRRKPLTCRKSLTNIMLYLVYVAWATIRSRPPNYD